MSDTLTRPRRPVLTLSGLRTRPLPLREDYSAIGPVAAVPEAAKPATKPKPSPAKTAPPPAAKPAAEPSSEPSVKKPKPAKTNSIHSPASEEVCAHNRKREAEWHAGPALVEQRLRALYPAVFNDKIVPLKIGIHHDINKLPGKEFDQDIVGRFLKRWTRRPEYRNIVNRSKDIARYGLDGTVSTTVERLETSCAAEA